MCSAPLQDPFNPFEKRKDRLDLAISKIQGEIIETLRNRVKTYPLEYKY